MHYGLYLAASGTMVNQYRQDVYANNLANVETVGFKRDLATVMQRAPETVEDNLGGELKHRILERLGGGALAGPQRISFAPGPLKQTGQTLDLALGGPATFFAVQGSGDGRNATVRLTRDGRLSLDREGYLITIAGARRVLDQGDQPIRVDTTAGTLSIDEAGRIVQAGQEVARLQITGVKDPNQLVKQGQNLYAWAGRQDPRVPAANPAVQQGFVEASDVDPIMALMNLTDATKAISANANMIRYHDTLMDRAVNVLGRVNA